MRKTQQEKTRKEANENATMEILDYSGGYDDLDIQTTTEHSPGPATRESESFGASVIPSSFNPPEFNTPPFSPPSFSPSTYSTPPSGSPSLGPLTLGTPPSGPPSLGPLALGTPPSGPPSLGPSAFSTPPFNQPLWKPMNSPSQSMMPPCRSNPAVGSFSPFHTASCSSLSMPSYPASASNHPQFSGDRFSHGSS